MMMAMAMAQDDHDNFVEKLGSERGESHQGMMVIGRKEKRKTLKKLKRKQVRKEVAMREREEEEARLNDPEEQMRLVKLEQEEAERMERDRKEFEERERKLLEDMEKKKQLIEDEEIERQKLLRESHKQIVNVEPDDLNEGDDEWEYVEDGPVEIIWQGNEIIVKKKKIRVLKKDVPEKNQKEDIERPISNPLAPQSEAFDDYKSAQELLDSVAQQVPNFGTEQDKAHCPFHLKTGVCRFGTRCSRFHFYPDKSCTLLMKNMYNGPGLSWEQDEGLEHTDEEIERCFEEFYEDVHTEFLKFGEIVNFKVCNNGCYHLRGNVYVQYKSVESALLANHSINGRYFAGKQVICEFVNITRWKVAICGEYMKTRLKSCSRGSACNFIHCFRNPGGDYEWADWDKPPPRYWVKKMAALFGHTDAYDDQLDEISPWKLRNSIKSTAANDDSLFGRSTSHGLDRNHVKTQYGDVDHSKSKRQGRHTRDNRIKGLDREIREERACSTEYHRAKSRSSVACFDVDQLDCAQDDEKSSTTWRSSSRSRKRHLELTKADSKNSRDHLPDAKRVWSDKNTDGCRENKSSSSKRRKRPSDIIPESRDETWDSDLDAARDENAYTDGGSKRLFDQIDDLDCSDMRSHTYSREMHDDLESQRKNRNKAELSSDRSCGTTFDRNEERHSKHRTKDSHSRRNKKSFHHSDGESARGSSDRGQEKHARE